MISTIADGMTRGAESVAGAVSQAFMEPVLRLGVTGLSRSGKTVFITSLVANLIARDRMPALNAAAHRRILAAFLQPQPDDAVPRFDYEKHLAALTDPASRWPENTRAVSQLRLSLRLQPAGMLSGLKPPRVMHLDIVDYPGEWLLDLGLLGKSYANWSADLLPRLEPRPAASTFLKLAGQTDPSSPFEERKAQELARAFTDYLHSARAAGLADCTPGRFLLPGDLAGSPVLTFAPLVHRSTTPRRSLYREMERRFEAYKAQVVKPFFRDHFARIDRQIVLCDVLGAIHDGPQALDDLRRAMADILGAFRPGTNTILKRLLMGRRVEKILFAATKADHLHHKQHPRLAAIVEALVAEARSRANFSGAETGAIAMASLRATTEEERTHNGQVLDCVRGTLINEDGSRGRQAAFYPGDLPDDPMQLLRQARDGAKNWLDADYGAMAFAPAPGQSASGGLPHIRLDRAAEFLLGDRL